MNNNLYLLLFLIVLSCKQGPNNPTNSKKNLSTPVVTKSTPLEVAIEDEAALIAKYDYAPYFKPKYTGDFGENASPIKLYFSNIYRSKNSLDTYSVIGYTIHQGTKVPFSGTITLEKVLKINNNQLNIMLNYELSEAVQDHGSGVFSGSGLVVKSDQGMFTKNSFIGTYTFPDGSVVLCNFK